MTEKKTYGFKTQEETQKVLDDAREKGLGFCPEIVQECCKDCVCYKTGNITPYQHDVNSKPKQWRINLPHCTHVNIAGAISTFSD